MDNSSLCKKNKSKTFDFRSIKYFLWKYKMDITIFLFVPYGTIIIPTKYLLKFYSKFRKNGSSTKKTGD